MITDAHRSLQSRTDAKIRYAEIHLEELHKLGHPDGSDFDRAHQESFLLHLLGVRDALMAEFNAYYDGGLSVDGITLGKLRGALEAKGRNSSELATLYGLEQDETSWYSIAKSMRDYTSHVGGVSRAYYVGGENHRKVKLRHPKTGAELDEHFLETFDKWIDLMRELVATLRASALKSCGLA